LATAPFLNETLIDDAIAALAAYRIFAPWHQSTLNPQRPIKAA
jgi:hypothetical protein